MSTGESVTGERFAKARREIEGGSDYEEKVRVERIMCCNEIKVAGPTDNSLLAK